MERRSLLGIGATTVVSLLAGCTTDGIENPATGDSPSTSPSPSTSDSPTASPSPTPSSSPTPASPRLTDTSFSASDATCGNQTEKASVTAETTDGSHRVIVTGTTSTPTPCYSAKLGAANFDAETGKLSVNVITTEPTEGSVCAQCIAEIDYDSTLTFENGLPESVTVSHDGERVTTEHL